MANSKKPGRWRNIRAHLEEGSVRVRYISGLAIMIIAAIMGYLMFQRSTKKVRSSQVVTVPIMHAQEYIPSLFDTDPQQATPAYDQLLAAENAASAKAAKETGNSAVPVIRQKTRTGNNSPAPHPTMPPAVSDTAFPSDGAGNTLHDADDLAWLNRETRENYRQAVTTRATAMRNQVNLLIASWQPRPHTSIAVHAVNRHTADNGTDNPVDNWRSRNRLQHSSQQAVPTPAHFPPPGPLGGSLNHTQSTLVHAGEIAYAVLDTAINTDEPGPVKAHVVQGALKGATLIGKIEAGPHAKKAGLHFTIASSPQWPKSTAVDAWAIDPGTARTALATHIDNHYLLRYGTLFASSFLSGLSDALLKGGQNQQIIPGISGPVVKTDAFTKKQLIMAGAGNVGKQAAANMTGTVNRPPTITIRAGLGIGILFITDMVKKP